jgi:hypothetical protein
VYVEDPAATPGAREGTCLASVFTVPDGHFRDVAGVVWRGESAVAGAVVGVTPSDVFLGEQRARGGSAVTDPAGFFGPIAYAPLRYDITVRADADVLVYRGVATRYVQPSFESSTTTPDRSWQGRVVVQLDAPLPEHDAVTFFTSGDAIDVTGDLERGVSLLGKAYSFPATVHAVVHDKGGDLSTAHAYGKVDVVVTAESPQLVRLAVEPIKDFRETKVTVSAPPGYAPQHAEILIGYSRTSHRRLTTMPIGNTKRLPVIPNHGYYAYRVRATLPDGAVSDSGERFFDVFSSENKIELPAVPVALRPADGAALTLNDRLEANGGKGLYEHVLVPKKGAGSIRIATSEPVASLPDLTALGAAPASGEYSWTVRSYPEIRFVDGFGGADGRRFLAMGVSAPRSVVFK